MHKVEQQNSALTSWWNIDGIPKFKNKSVQAGFWLLLLYFSSNANSKVKFQKYKGWNIELGFY